MNLYLFNDNDSAATYGIGTYIKELTKVLESADIAIHVVHLHSSSLEFKIEKTDTVEHWHIPNIFNTSNFDGTVRKMNYYFQNVVYLLRLYIGDTTGLVFHFNYNRCHALAKGLKEAFNCKTVTTVHFTKWMLELNSNFSLFKAIKSKPETQRNAHEQLLVTTDENETLLFEETDQVIALCRFMQNTLQTGYGIKPEKIKFIPNGLEEMEWMALSPEKNEDKGISPERIRLRKKWLLSENELLILFAGRLNPVKGLAYLIRAFHDVLKLAPNCRLIIAGNGDYNSYMKECEGIWTHITWTGLLDKEKLYELYSIADIGVMPSFHEQCSYVAIEMMRHGLPIIGSTTTGLKEMIIDWETGLHIPVIESDYKVEIDTALLAEKIQFLINKPELRLRMGHNARKNYEHNYTTDLFRENMLNFYHSLY